MDSAILTAAIGIIGSIVGAASSMTSTWMTQTAQQKTLRLSDEAAKREALYAQFIDEAAKCLADATSREPDGVEVLVILVATMGRMRMKSSMPVIEAADELIQLIVSTYGSPNKTFADIEIRMKSGNVDPLAKFGEVCRTELDTLRL